MKKEIKNFIGKKLLSVEELEDETIKIMRLAKCKKCPMYDAENDTCKVCGCLMKIKAGLLTNRNPKAFGRIEKTHCPIGAWNDKETANIYRKKDNLELLT